VVGELYRADAAGEDPSVHAMGELARVLRLEYETERHRELAVRSFVSRRLELVHADGESAVVAVDGRDSGAVRQRHGGWKAFGARFRGRARVVRVDGVWKVRDAPYGRASRCRTLSPVAEAARDGDLELELAVEERPSREMFIVVVHNRGVETLTIASFRVLATFLRRFPLRIVVPLSEAQTVPAGESWGFRHSMGGPHRTRRGCIEVVAADGDGRTHSARARYSPAPRPDAWTRIRRRVGLARVFELAALLLFVWRFLPGWTVSFFLPAVLLLFAAVVRALTVLYFLRFRSGGLGLALLVGLVAAELIVASALLFAVDFSWGALIIWVTAAGLVAQSAARFWNAAR